MASKAPMPWVMALAISSPADCERWLLSFSMIGCDKGNRNLSKELIDLLKSYLAWKYIFNFIG